MTTRGQAELPFDALLQGVSRTFALSIPELPGPLSDWVGSAYLVCRIIDTIEDRPDSTAEQRQIMFDELLTGLGPPVDVVACRRLADQFAGGDPDDPCVELMQRCEEVFSHAVTFPPGAIDAIRDCAVEMIDGLRRTPLTVAGDDPRFLCRTLEDLETYCHYAAGVVGMMLTRLFDLHLGRDPGSIPDRRLDLARRFGRGLQLTNIIKDHPSDLADGRVFMPPELARRCDLPPDALLQPALPLAVRALVVTRAVEHLDRAFEYTVAFPPDARGIRLFCLQPLMMALLTLDRVLTHMDTTPDDRPKISREQVSDVMSTSRRLISDNAGLAEWYREHRAVLSHRLGELKQNY